MNYAKACAKALTAATTAAIGAIVTASSDNTVTNLEVAIIVLTTLGAAAATWAVPNKDDEGEHQDESVQPKGA